MAGAVTVCIDTNVLLGFFNAEPDKVESCNAFFQLLFTRRIKAVVATITLLELAAILTGAGQYAEAERIISSIQSLPNFSVAEFQTKWVLPTAALKKANRLAMADAIIVSTAIETRCTHLITFDADFRSIEEIPVLTPHAFLEQHSA